MGRLNDDYCRERLDMHLKEGLVWHFLPSGIFLRLATGTRKKKRGQSKFPRVLKGAEGYFYGSEPIIFH